MTRRARILLVDDDEVDFVITRKLLARVSGQEYELDWAESYEEGVAELARGRHDACLVDYRLGPRSGLDLLRHASAHGWNVPMILLTGQGSRDVDAEALALGAVGYLEKARLGVGELDRALRYALAREGLVTELIEHNAELLCMQHITSRLLGSGTLQERVGLALEELARHTDLPAAALEALVDDGKLHTIASRGLPRQDVRSSEYPIEASPAADALLARRPVVVSSAGGAPPSAWPWARTLIALPLEAGGESMGAITLASSDERAIDSDELQRAASLAAHIAQMLRFADPVLGT